MPPSQNADSGDGAPIRILYVDDEPELRSSVSYLLEHVGYAVETACDGVDAWEKIKRTDYVYDVVITDRQMPHMGGEAFAQSLRSANYRTRIIVFSSTPKAALAEAFRTVPVDGVVEKGGDVEALSREVARVTQLR